MHQPRKGNLSEPVKILMVVDGEFSYGPSYFGLFNLLKNLLFAKDSWVKFHIYPTHRSYDANWDEVVPKLGPGMTGDIFSLAGGFRFDENMGTQWGPQKGKYFLETIDQIWFFGFRQGTGGLKPGELVYIRNFMDEGGGVFATGDHMFFGRSLCGDLPRIKFMRKWNEKIPNAWALQRNSSITPTDEFIDERDQGLLQFDDIPMKLDVRHYHCYQWPHPSGHLPVEASQPESDVEIPSAFDELEERMPHPLLSARDPEDKVIDVLPDHLHEGEVVALDAKKWWDLTTKKLIHRLYEVAASYFPKALSTLRSDSRLLKLKKFTKEHFKAHPPTKKSLKAWQQKLLEVHPLGGEPKKTFVQQSSDILNSGLMEFPPDFNNHPLPWEVVASADNQDVSPLAKRATLIKSPRPKEYGVIGAYDGCLTQTGVGRIVVDSSFHHWIDANLTGIRERQKLVAKRRNIRDPKFRRGFLTERGRPTLKEINTYHRNVAFWLTPRAKQKLLAAFALRNSLFNPPLTDAVDTALTTWQIGRAVIINLGPMYGETMVRTWWTYFFDPEILGTFFNSLKAISHDQLLLMDDYLIGGIAREILNFENLSFRLPGRRKTIELAERGVEEGKALFVRDLLAYCHKELALAKYLKKMGSD